MKFFGEIIADEDIVTKKYVDDGLADKQDTLVNGDNIKTVNNESLLGSGNILSVLTVAEVNHILNT